MALYPPIVASSMPAFDNNQDGVKIYFTLSPYNSSKRDQIQSVQVTVRKQATNVNVIKNNSAGILQKDFVIKQDEENGGRTAQDVALNRYFITITQDDVGGFQTNVLYKIQLRLSTRKFTPYAQEGNETSEDNEKRNKRLFVKFCSDQISNFSQWSTVCIIKPIDPPLFYIDGFFSEDSLKSSSSIDTSSAEDDENFFSSSIADFVGIYKKIYNVYDTEEEEETTINSSQKLKSWRLRLLDQHQNLLADSGEKFVSSNNYNVDTDNLVIECSLPYQLTDGSKYFLIFDILTKNGYQKSATYTFNCSLTNISSINGELKTIINEQEGYIKIECTSPETINGNLVIRRSDSLSGFKKWEDLYNFYGTPSCVYYDFTVESGVLYRYLIQKRDTRGRRGTPLYDQNLNANLTGAMVEWQHAFLLQSTGNGQLQKTKQLKLKYDFQISSYKTNISESRTDTIGSQYPFIRRNGNMYYRSFPISGTITGFMDDADLFTNITELYNGYYNHFQAFRGDYNQNNAIYSKQYDYTYERKFREKVEQFLYNSKPKLYKSMQEGNILIKLMQVSLTPKNQLGRLIYTFSATAYEIDKVNISTLNNYGFINVGQYQTEASDPYTLMTQLTSYNRDNPNEPYVFPAGQDIMGADLSPSAYTIASKVKYQQSFNTKKTSAFRINYLRLIIESQPYLIKQQGNTFRPVDDIKEENGTREEISNSIIEHPLYQIESTFQENENYYLGTLFTFVFGNGESKQIIISHPNNIYEISDSRFSLDQNCKIIPAKDTIMSVDLVVDYDKVDDQSLDKKSIKMNKVNGQLVGTYSKKDQIIQLIKYKYNYTYYEGSYKVVQSVTSQNIHSILIDTQPGTVIKMATTKDSYNNLNRFVVNETGELRFEPGSVDTGISRLKIQGRNILLQYCRNRNEKQYNNINQVTNPMPGDYCVINNQCYYYYRSEWCKASFQDNDSSIDFETPVDALVFYYINVGRDYY